MKNSLHGNISRWQFVCIAIGIATLSASAQQPVAPTLPIRPEANARWKVSATEDESSKTNLKDPTASLGLGFPVEIYSTKVGNIKEDRFVGRNAALILYYMQGVGFQRFPNTEKVYPFFAERQKSPAQLELRSPGFPGLDWLSTSNYKGIITDGSGNTVHRFSEELKSRRLSPDLVEDFPAREALIDAASGRPISVQFGSMRLEFLFAAPIATPPVIPKEILAYAEGILRQAKTVNRLRNGD